MSVRLELLTKEFEEEFIIMNQSAFNCGAKQYFTDGEMIEKYEEEGEIISKETIINSIHHKGSFAYQMMYEDKMVGGIIINIQNEKGDLEIFFVDPAYHSKGIRQLAWKEIESIHSNVRVWETVTRCFEKRTFISMSIS